MLAMYRNNYCIGDEQCDYWYFSNRLQIKAQISGAYLVLTIAHHLFPRELLRLNEELLWATL